MSKFGDSAVGVMHRSKKDDMCLVLVTDQNFNTSTYVYRRDPQSGKPISIDACCGWRDTICGHEESIDGDSFMDGFMDNFIGAGLRCNV
jgi:hypothetical protein